MTILVIAGLGILFVLWALSRMFKKPQQNQFTNPGNYGPNPNPQGYGPNPAQGRGVPPQGYAPTPGYGPAPAPGGYPPPGYGPVGYGPPPQQAGGGGFMQGALGGLGGAVVGNILYDKFGRPHDSAPAQGFPHNGGGVLPPTQESGSDAWPGEPSSAPQPSESYDPNAGAGGDWGAAAPEPAQNEGTSGDWGTPEPEPEPEQNNDWGTPEPEPQPEPDQGGGDWGGDAGGSDDQGQGGSW